MKGGRGEDEGGVEMERFLISEKGDVRTTEKQRELDGCLRAAIRR